MLSWPVVLRFSAGALYVEERGGEGRDACGASLSNAGLEVLNAEDLYRLAIANSIKCLPGESRESYLVHLWQQTGCNDAELAIPRRKSCLGEKLQHANMGRLMRLNDMEAGCHLPDTAIGLAIALYSGGQLQHESDKAYVTSNVENHRTQASAACRRSGGL